MYVNKIVFLVTISRHLKFATIHMLANRQEKTIAKSLIQVMRVYGSRGFLVKMTHADGEFEVLCGRLADAGSGLNVCSNAEHIPEIKRFIRTVKERAHCMYNSVPFQQFPILMIKEMVTACVFWLNMFPLTTGYHQLSAPGPL
jgi:hypothetical protein